MPTTKPEPVAEPVAPTLRADVAQLVDEHWPVGGDAWQQQQAFARREAFKTALTTILVSNQ
jgi:hypothetical protein